MLRIVHFIYNRGPLNGQHAKHLSVIDLEFLFIDKCPILSPVILHRCTMIIFLMLRVTSVFSQQLFIERLIGF